MREPHRVRTPPVGWSQRSMKSRQDSPEAEKEALSSRSPAYFLHFKAILRPFPSAPQQLIWGVGEAMAADRPSPSRRVSASGHPTQPGLWGKKVPVLSRSHGPGEVPQDSSGIPLFHLVALPMSLSPFIKQELEVVLLDHSPWTGTRFPF